MLEAAFLRFRLVPPRANGAAQVGFRRFQWYFRCSWRLAPRSKFLSQFRSIEKAVGTHTVNGRWGALDHARSLGLEVRACGKDDKSRSNQPRDDENCALLCACAGQSECHCEQHTREHMSRCPNECRQDICRIKLSRRHLEDAGYQRHKGADDGRKACKKDACHAVSGYKSFTSGNELRILIQRPGSQNLLVISLA